MRGGDFFFEKLTDPDRLILPNHKLDVFHLSIGHVTVLEEFIRERV